MTNAQTKAEQLCREANPELGKYCRTCGGTGDGADNPMSDFGGCYLCVSCNGTGRSKKAFHPIQLQHWLKLLGKEVDDVDIENDVMNVLTYTYDGLDDNAQRIRINFNLITGQPATEKDYQAILDIVGV